MYLCYKKNLETMAAANILFRVFELSFHSEKESGVSVLCCKNSILIGLFQTNTFEVK